MQDYSILYIPSKDETILVYFGTGGNLEREDYEAGFNDYVNIYTYKGKISQEEFLEKDEDWDQGSYDGGMYLFNNERMISDFTGEVVNYWYNEPLKYEYLGCAIETYER